MSEASPAASKTEAWWRRLTPFVLALGLLTWLLLSVDLEQVGKAIVVAPKFELLGFAFAFMITLLAADAWATSRVYARAVCPVKFQELFVLRGASYLPSIVSHHVGQGWLTYFLAKVYDARLWRVAGATLIVYITNFACLVGIGLAALPFNAGRLAWMAPALGVCVAGGCGYLVVLAVRPKWLAEHQLLGPLFGLGVAGHLATTLERLPHVLILFFGSWVPFLLFRIDVPFTDALALVPPMMFVAALPLTPQGVGTRDALATYLLASYAPAGSDGAARVVACTLSWAACITIVQLVISPLLMRRAYRLLKASEGAVSTRSP